MPEQTVAPSATPASVRGESSFVWWCAACCRSGPFTDADLSRYARDGWPGCCGRKEMCHAPSSPARK